MSGAKDGGAGGDAAAEAAAYVASMPPHPRIRAGVSAAPYYPAPHPLQGVDVPLLIPSSSMLAPMRSPLRMRLMLNYMAATDYNSPTPAEASLLAKHSRKTWLQMFFDLAVPATVWVATAPRMSEHECFEAAGADMKKAARLQMMYGRSLGWAMPVRLLTIAGCIGALKGVSGTLDANTFAAFAEMESPLGEYARYLEAEGQKAAELKLQGVDHPPFPTPAEEAEKKAAPKKVQHW